MDVTAILNELNEAQREAVSAPPANMLVLAGAGSGKTRVLVHRMAWLIRVEGVSPFGLLAMTFTNKAAAEMRQRTESLLGMPISGLWVGTFHGTCHRLLRTHWKEANLPQSFQILDTQDQLRLVKRVLKNLDLDETRWPPKQAQWFINARKDEGLRPQHLEDNGDMINRQLIRIYNMYQEACQRLGVIDFAELLLRTLEMLRDNDILLQHYRSRFRHILVDEFQDTNTIQYALLRLLAGDKSYAFAVGDDDQSIYGWRGARVENIQSYNRDFKQVQLIRLERNYRSTGNILEAANHLIRNNEGRLGKELWTDSGAGDPICLYAADNEQDEARFVADRIQQWVDDGGRRSDVAVLYRSNAQSRVFEETFISRQMPYRVYGGLRFFERAEIKDALAYLRVCSNHHDDASFERVVNQPSRGIGERTLDRVREQARQHAVSLWDAANDIIKSGDLSARANNTVQGFLQLIREITSEIEGLPLFEQVEHAVQKSGLYAFFEQDKGEKAESRKENLDELVNAARSFEDYQQQHHYQDMLPLDAFLAHAVLESGEGQADSWEDCVQMMTLHTAKGLEFLLVFLAGVEEGLFPHHMSIEEPGRLEEERRLCYVGITRARRHLVISFAQSRRLHGQENYGAPSRFIAELPAELIEELRPRAVVQKTHYEYSRVSNYRAVTEQSGFSGIQIGQRVMHQRFGEGVVLDCEGQGSHARVQVNFENEGCKWLVMAYANLVTL